MRERFVSRMSDRVSARDIQFSKAIEDARAFVEEAIDKAASYEIVAEEDVCRFIDILQELGPDFPEGIPWAKELINDEDLDAAFRIDAIEERAAAVEEVTK